MAHGGGGRAKVTPNLAVNGEGTRTLNLTVLQRLDPAVEDILITAAHVTLYDFDTDVNQWVRARARPLRRIRLHPKPLCVSRWGILDAWLVHGLICVLVVGFAEPEGCRGVALRRQEVRTLSLD